MTKVRSEKCGRSLETWTPLEHTCLSRQVVLIVDIALPPYSPFLILPQSSGMQQQNHIFPFSALIEHIPSQSSIEVCSTTTTDNFALRANTFISSLFTISFILISSCRRKHTHASKPYLSGKYTCFWQLRFKHCTNRNTDCVSCVVRLCVSICLHITTASTITAPSVTHCDCLPDSKFPWSTTRTTLNRKTLPQCFLHHLLRSLPFLVGLSAFCCFLL